MRMATPFLLFVWKWAILVSCASHTKRMVSSYIKRRSVTWVSFFPILYLVLHHRFSTRPFKIECVFCIRKFWKLNARTRKHNTNARNLHGPLWSKVTWFYKNRKLARWLTSLQCITSSDVHYWLGYKYIWRIKIIAFHQLLKVIENGQLFAWCDPP